MSVPVGCPGCGQAMKVPDDAWGKEVLCPYCATRFVLAVVAASAENMPSPEPRPTSAMENDACEGSGAITSSPILRPATPPPRREPDRRLAARLDRGPKRSLVRRDQRGKPSWVIVGASVAGALLVAGIVAVVLIFRRGGTIPESDWQEFTAPDGSCSVQMPGTPVPLKQTMNGLTLQKYIVVRGKERVEFAVAYTDVPAGMLDLTAAAALERDSLKGVLDAEVAGERALSLGSHPGREFRL
jgi:hypothetical protein